MCQVTLPSNLFDGFLKRSGLTKPGKTIMLVRESYKGGLE
jgi:hypothetical protein